MTSFFVGEGKKGDARETGPSCAVGKKTRSATSIPEGSGKEKKKKRELTAHSQPKKSFPLNKTEKMGRHIDQEEKK